MYLDWYCRNSVATRVNYRKIVVHETSIRHSKIAILCRQGNAFRIASEKCLHLANCRLSVKTEARRLWLLFLQWWTVRSDGIALVSSVLRVNVEWYIVFNSSNRNAVEVELTLGRRIKVYHRHTCGALWQKSSSEKDANVAPSTLKLSRGKEGSCSCLLVHWTQAATSDALQRWGSVTRNYQNGILLNLGPIMIIKVGKKRNSSSSRNHNDFSIS